MATLPVVILSHTVLPLQLNSLEQSLIYIYLKTFKQCEVLVRIVVTVIAAVSELSPCLLV